MAQKLQETVENYYDGKGYGVLSKIQNVGKFQIIALYNGRDLFSHINEFHCNLSKVAYFLGKEPWLYISQDFMNGVRNKTLEFGKGASDEYKTKICAKFPDYKVVEL